MAKIEMKGMDKYIRQLEAVQWATTSVCKAAVYVGAEKVADAIRAEMDSLSAVSDAQAKAAARLRNPCLISHTQKRDMIEGFGVARMEDNRGYISTKLGFKGYNSIKTKKFPNGQPNALIARACNSGSTAMLKQPFIDKAVKNARPGAIQAMDDKLNEQIEKITGGK